MTTDVDAENGEVPSWWLRCCCPLTAHTMIITNALTAMKDEWTAQTTAIVNALKDELTAIVNAFKDETAAQTEVANVPVNNHTLVTEAGAGLPDGNPEAVPTESSTQQTTEQENDRDAGEGSRATGNVGELGQFLQSSEESRRGAASTSSHTYQEQL